MAGGDQLPSGVIQLVHGTGPPQRNNAGGRGQPPVPPPVPVPPANARVQGIPPPPGVGQHQVVPMHPPQMPQPVAFAPPAVHMIPPEFCQRKLVEISDIRRERTTEADAREVLSEYAIFRFEKLLDENEVDEEGYQVMPTWENVIRTEVRDMNKHAATRQVRYLERTTKPVNEKKASLIPAQQRQIERALEELNQAERDHRYHYVLVQIDHQLKKIDKHSVTYHPVKYKESKYKETKYKETKYKDGKRVMIGRKSSSSSKDRKRPKYQRVSLTAFYKRTPRPEENALRLLQIREHELQRRNFPPPMMQPQVILPQHFQPLPAAQPQPQPQQLRNGGNGAAVVEVNPGRGGVRIIHQQSPRSSRSSWSDGDSSHMGTELTPDSSMDSASYSSKRGRRRSRSRHRHRERPEQFGIDAPRQHSRHEQHHIFDDFLPHVPAPPSPLGLPSPLDVEDAYQRGRLDEQVRLLEEIRPRAIMPPRIVQERIPVRMVLPEEVAHRRYEDELDRLERLRIEEDRAYEDRLDLEERIRDEEIRRRQALEVRHRRQRMYDDAIAREEDAMWAEGHARDYMRRRERPSFDNPFAPIGRRHSTYNI